MVADKPVEIIEGEASPFPELIDDKLIQFILRHRLILGNAHDLLGEPGGGVEGDIDLEFLHFRVQQETLLRVAFHLLFLVFAVGPLAGAEEEEEAAFPFGGEELIAGDRDAVD